MLQGRRLGTLVVLLACCAIAPKQAPALDAAADSLVRVAQDVAVTEGVTAGVGGASQTPRPAEIHDSAHPSPGESGPAPVAVPSVEQPGDALQEARGYDAYGFDYRSQKAGSYAECKFACITDDACKALTYNSEAGVCFLKSGVSLLMKNPIAQAAYDPSVNPGVRFSELTVYSRTDYAGYDYFVIQRTDFEACFMACENDSRCRAFSFARKNRSCWLKSEVGVPKVNRHVDSGVK